MPIKQQREKITSLGKGNSENHPPQLKQAAGPCLYWLFLPLRSYAGGKHRRRHCLQQCNTVCTSVNAKHIFSGVCLSAAMLVAKNPGGTRPWLKVFHTGRLNTWKVRSRSHTLTVFSCGRKAPCSLAMQPRSHTHRRLLQEDVPDLLPQRPGILGVHLLANFCAQIEELEGWGREKKKNRR